VVVVEAGLEEVLLVEKKPMRLLVVAEAQEVL
jgi:hypothetical protein